MHLVYLVFLSFYDDLVLPFCFLKWNRYFSACESLPNSLCHFWKHKSVLPQILHQSSVPSNITPPYFFSSTIIYFDQKEPIKAQIFETFKCLGQKSLDSSYQFWNGKSIHLQILHLSSLSRHRTHNSSVNFKLIHFLLWIKGSHQSPNFENFKWSGEIWQILHVIFQTTGQFFFKFCITLQCHER